MSGWWEELFFSIDGHKLTVPEASGGFEGTVIACCKGVLLPRCLRCVALFLGGSKIETVDRAWMGRKQYGQLVVG